VAKRKRLDEILVEKGLFETRSKAQAAIMAGDVFVDGQKQTKAGAPTGVDASIELAAKSPYVSRGGLKLDSALKAFPQIRPNGRICLDLGSSTGGFTDCLLQRGAAKVYAIDVGTAQLDAKLKADPRVVSREQTHAKYLKPDQFDPRPDLAVVDVSFISLTQVLPSLLPCLKAPFEVLALVKPQFEVGPKLAPKGVVREDSAREAAIEKVRQALAALALAEAGLFECPVHGPKGNIEFFMFLINKPETGSP
jgi:23S rRNA (cytidine1920-2'-O)/16S rRNA (cytidine1409-2'-O)-methyltransferase